MLMNFKEGFRSFYTFIIGSVDQKAAKLLAVRGHYKKSVTLAITAEMFASVWGLALTLHVFSKYDGRQICSPLLYRL